LDIPHFKEISVSHDSGVDWLTLNRPQALNAITPTMACELADYFAGLNEQWPTRVVVMRGAGRAFCAGLDLKAQARGQTENERMPLVDIIRNMRACPQPIVALVHGAACGGGFAFALAADIRIAGESARMNDAFVTLGVSGCELGLSYFLPRIVGLSVAAELMYTGRFIDGHRAASVGLVSRVVSDDQLDDAGRDMVGELLRVAPLALRRTKEVLNESLRLNKLDYVLKLEAETQLACMKGPDFSEAIRAFVEKRPPVFGK
jgi:enoyl-CoA hydratase